jgi:hypothetical protein
VKWILTMLFAFALIAPARLIAHEGHAHKTMGTVTAVHDNQLEVKDKDGKTSTHVIDAKTKLRRGKIAVKIADVKAGDRVVVTSLETKDKAGKAVVTVTQVDLGDTAAAPAKTKR